MRKFRLCYIAYASLIEKSTCKNHPFIFDFLNQTIKRIIFYKKSRTNKICFIVSFFQTDIHHTIYAILNAILRLGFISTQNNTASRDSNGIDSTAGSCSVICDDMKPFLIFCVFFMNEMVHQNFARFIQEITARQDCRY